MLSLFKSRRTYYVLSLLLICTGLIALLFLEKGELVLYFDSIDSPRLDQFFLMVTKGGEHVGGIIVLLSLVLFGAKRKYFIILICSATMALAVSQGLKHLVFSHEDRPSSVYEDLKPIDGLERHKHNSFPSGHTTTAFTFFTVLALAYKPNWMQALCAFSAAMVGISRVYLGQHYLNDVVAGAALGIFIASSVTVLFNKYEQSEEM